MIERLLVMLKKEFIQVFRDPKLRGLVILVPIVQTVVFGFAVTTDVRDIRTAVYDLDATQDSRDLLSRFTRSGYFRVIENIATDARARELLDSGDVRTLLRVNRGFSEDLQAGRTATLQIILDGTDSNSAGIVLSYAQAITSRFNEEAATRRLARAGPAPANLETLRLDPRAWFNEDLESRNFYVPGVIVLIVTLVSLMLSSMAVVREKEIGTIEQIMVTPITRLEFILGKTIPFALVGFADVAIVTAVASLVFNVPIRGDLLLLAPATALFLMSTLGVGLLISTVSRTQQQAMMTAIFLNFPAVLLSGFIFPIANMPDIIQWTTYANPLRYFLIIVRGIFLKGVGLPILWPQIAALAILGTAMLWLASTRFKKTLA